MITLHDLIWTAAGPASTRPCGKIKLQMELGRLSSPSNSRIIEKYRNPNPRSIFPSVTMRQWELKLRQSAHFRLLEANCAQLGLSWPQGWREADVNKTLNPKP